MIGIVDYGAGNLLSVSKAVRYLGFPFRIITSEKDFAGVNKIILPGVGAFGSAIEQLHQKKLIQPLQKWLQEDQPFLGICLGMQVLFESSEEAPGIAGLGYMKGTVVKFQSHKVPQIGWNKVWLLQQNPVVEAIPDGAFFYFLHGYYVAPEDSDIILAETEYGVRYPSMVIQGNVMGVQFHPEKSAENGLTLLKNWLQL
ncbi:MAG: imidazole glycerol phosphate synthase subunit HisH [Calditrichaeota bacterium]|nr:MAG: imidazole glycerol phosphate synthase subunit HisH [Calditrichota bacterium]